MWPAARSSAPAGPPRGIDGAARGEAGRAVRRRDGGPRRPCERDPAPQRARRPPRRLRQGSGRARAVGGRASTSSAIACASSTRTSARSPIGWRGRRPRACSRPGRELAAARRGRARVQLQRRWSARHAHGPDRGVHGRGPREPPARARAGRRDLPLGRGARVASHRARDRGDAAAPPFTTTTSSRRWCAARRDARAAPASIRPPSPSRPCASTSTASWKRWRRRSSAWPACSPPAAVLPPSPSTAWRTARSSTPSATWPAATAGCSRRSRCVRRTRRHGATPARAAPACAPGADRGRGVRIDNSQVVREVDPRASRDPAGPGRARAHAGGRPRPLRLAAPPDPRDLARAGPHVPPARAPPGGEPQAAPREGQPSRTSGAWRRSPPATSGCSRRRRRGWW
jgi:hypothetical protein